MVPRRARQRPLGPQWSRYWSGTVPAFERVPPEKGFRSRQRLRGSDARRSVGGDLDPRLDGDIGRVTSGAQPSWRVEADLLQRHVQCDILLDDGFSLRLVCPGSSYPARRRGKQQPRLPYVGK
jgi:hypothetical protein